MKNKRKIRKKRGSSRYFVIFIFISIILFSIFLGAKTLIGQINWLEISKIEVKGNVNLDKDYLINLSKDLIGQNLYSVSKQIVMLRYENIIRLEDISIKRKLPHTLQLKIKERVGVFYIKSLDGLLFPIDKNRIVLDNDVFYETEILPVISTNIPTKEIFYGEVINNEFIEEIFAFVAEVEKYDDKFVSKISEFYQLNNDICIFESETGYRIIFSDENLEFQLERFNFVLDNRNFAKNTTVDLRFEPQLIIQSEANWEVAK